MSGPGPGAQDARAEQTIRLHVVHTTTFRYAEPVSASYNEARMTPLQLPHQRVVASTTTVLPQTWSVGFRDYFGTAVTAFEVLAPHQSLRIVADHLVELTAPPAPPATTGWDDLAAPSVLDGLAEYLAQTPATDPHPEVVGIAAAARSGLDPAPAAHAICTALRERVSYIPGVTTVHTPAAEAWAAGAGVCQDLAHLVVGALRSVGIPARYVSGYLHPDARGPVGETVTGESHAWVEWWLGDWYGFDPTNSVPAAAHHVLLGRARGYDDVAPLRGIYAGGGSAELEVEVEITRES